MRTAQPRRPVTDADLDLLFRLQGGDRDAFGELYRRTADVLTRYVAARLRDRDSGCADDLVHDAFCDALADPGLLEPDLLGSMLRLSARAVTRHTWAQRRYLRTAYTVYEGRTLNTVDTVDNALETTRATVLARPGFSHALARLTTLQRRAIQLRYLDGYRRDHTAQMMGRSVAAVRDLERRALRRLHAAHTG
ncbi:RNA polymerase sigma factor [Micromonospora sp. ATA51]|uniref:RNA polymerase sigma factor n=1 Tax=Micromonospora sp. ATA51 TaxID=2806098 RepID=UPI001A622227|nr:RNA polymerase sigma factor [Micromonospora sp. ATA51]MBM0226129.1 RNA polymerase sigma factor [Micromonospora sp. ATA51]